MTSKNHAFNGWNAFNAWKIQVAVKLSIYTQANRLEPRCLRNKICQVKAKIEFVASKNRKEEGSSVIGGGRKAESLPESYGFIEIKQYLFLFML